MAIIHDMSNADYHAHPALSKSGTDDLEKSPMHFKARREKPREETPAMALGTAVHALTLEPESFWDRYIVAPPGIDRRTTAGKAAWANIENSGKIVLKAEDMQQIEAMASAVRAHPVTEALFDEGRAEVSFFSRLSDVDVKCRPDWFREDGIIVDLKTTEDASPGGFASSVAKWNYHKQAAFYSDILSEMGISVAAFVFIAVEKTYPYAVGVYELDLEALDLGRQAYRANLETYRTCLETGQWPGYSSNVEVLNLPRWKYLQQAA